MRVFQLRGEMPAPVGELFAWHARPGAFERLMPPDGSVRLIERHGTILQGDRVSMHVAAGPAWVRWDAHIVDYVEGRQFVDEQVRGPFAAWRHTHRFMPGPRPEVSLLEDHVEYRLPGGPLGNLLAGWNERKLQSLFAWRHERTRGDLQRHQRYAQRPRLRVLISGASGLVGAQLASFLTTGGHEAVRLVRRSTQPGADEIAWRPERGQIDAAALEGFDAVVHLGGENIAGGRWTPARKEAIRSSRVQSAELLASALATLKRRPEVLVCASAVGIYGDRGDEVITEDSSAAEGFLPEVCREWEAACTAAGDAGIRVVNARLGIVLSPGGGALQKMLTPFRSGAGGVVGSGRQVMSWIALDDAVGALHHILWECALRGPVNLTAPQPATNADFTAVLGRVLRRPTVMPLPSALVKLLFGEMGERLLLEGARVLPQRLTQSGFVFLRPALEGALRWELGQASGATA